MKFDIDVLIVFADSDNEPADKNGLGWVSQFKRFLELMLTQVLGEKPKVLLKAEHDTITSPSIDNAAVLVTVLSKAFIGSGRCLDHVELFQKNIEGQIQKRNRIFKVFKNPLTIMEQPPRLRDLIGYDMYQLDPESGEIKEYTDYFTSEAERQYWMKMVDLAYDIFDTLLFIKDEHAGKNVRNIFTRKTIYLAETGHDLSVQRNIIKRELQRHGYIVLPNHTLISNLADLEKAIINELNESTMAIHLIGAAYGEIPEGSDRSIIDIQNRLAAEKSQRAKESGEEFSRLIWISPNLSNASERQKAFIEKIKRDVESQEGAEILQTPLEDFKNIMREELIDSGEKKAEHESGGRSIYLVHDRVDQNEVRPIADFIEKFGFRVLMPKFDGQLLDLRKQHIENLKNLDAAIIYHGKVNEQWVRMKVLDLLKAPGFGRNKPIVGKAILAAPGSTLKSENFKSQNITLIEDDRKKSFDSLKNFLQEFTA